MSEGRRRPYRRVAVKERTYRETVADNAAEAMAAMYRGLLARGVPEQRPAEWVAYWFVRVGAA